MAHILVLDQSRSLLERDLRSLFDVRLGVPDSGSKNRNEVRHGPTHLVGCGSDKELEDVEAAGLDLPLSGGLDLLEERGEDDHGSPWVHRLDDRLDGSNGGILDGSDLVGKGFEKCGERGVDCGRDDEWLEKGCGTVLTESRNDIACCLAGGGRILVGQCLDALLAEVKNWKMPEIGMEMGSLTLTMVSLNWIEAKYSTPSFLAAAARLRADSSRTALSATKRVATSNAPVLEGATGEVAEGAIMKLSLSAKWKTRDRHRSPL